jgi:hypothetical protein
MWQWLVTQHLVYMASLYGMQSSHMVHWMADITFGAQFCCDICGWNNSVICNVLADIHMIWI